MGPPLDGVIDPGSSVNSGLGGQKHRICKHKSKIGVIRNKGFWLIFFFSHTNWKGYVSKTKILREPTMQRQNAENLKQIFPEKEYRGLSPNFHIHVSVSELYTPTMGLPVLLEEICGLEIYKSLKDT